MAKDDLEEEIEEILEDVDDDEDEEEEKAKEIVKVVEEKGFLSNLTKEDVILVILLLIIGIAIGYIVFRSLNKKSDYVPYMPIHRNDILPQAPPDMHNVDELKMHGRKHRGKKVDIESGDIILEEPHTMENWVIKKDMYGDIIDAYKTYSDDTLV